MRKPTSSTATATATAEAAAAGGGPAAKSTPCCIKVGLKRGPWTPEEDELLANYIKKEGEANHLQESLKEPIKIASSGLEETTSGSAHIISNKENGYFQNNSNAHLGDQYHTDHFIANRGYTSLLNYDGSFGTDLRGNQRLGNGEAEDINSGTEDVFSFLNSLINEEAFQQHQIFNEPNVNSAPASTDPLYPIAAATSFGLSTGWESTLMPSALDQNDSK
ncbi:hypothetical protein H0E87_005852 [Populus deltoides]|uniref:Uncharacterized protein n=1 Tax=Populus deltoides TaxID=3696 RepID=A0A8T2Z4L5_POPDE|nr:hypothetical protein H0E87_005852 [Populus deltoides]